MTLSPIRATLAIAVIMALFTYAFAVRPLEALISARYADLEATRSLLQRDLVFVQRRPALERERARLRAQLGGLRLRDSRPATVDRFLRRLARITAAGSISVASIAGEAPQPALGMIRPVAGAAEFDELSLDVGVRGPYSDLLHAIRELSDGDVATQVAISSLGNAERRGDRPAQLHATLRVTLLRETDGGIAHAS